MRRYAVTTRFYAFLALLAVLVIAVTALVLFRPLPLLGPLGRHIDLESLTEIEVTTVEAAGQTRTTALSDATAIRGVLAALDGARVRRQLIPGAVEEVVPGEALRLRLTDRAGREAVFDLAGRQVTFNLKDGYSLLEPASSSLAASISASN